MRLKLYFSLTAVFAGFIAFDATAASQKTPTPSTGNTNLVVVTPMVEIPQSVFKEGRNPFFPRSTVAVPLPTNPNASQQTDSSSIILNGITSPPKRTAMINGYTFEIGEEHEIKLPSGLKAMVKCEDIKSDSAVIIVNGVRRELRLRFGL